MRFESVSEKQWTETVILLLFSLISKLEETVASGIRNGGFTLCREVRENSDIAMWRMDERSLSVLGTKQ